MKWPRGKYNGQRIVGVGVRIRIHIRYWHLNLIWKLGTYFIQIGPVLMHFETVYE